MPSPGFEPATSATNQPQTYALEHAATGIGGYIQILNFIQPFNIHPDRRPCMCQYMLTLPYQLPLCSYSDTFYLNTVFSIL